MRVRPAMWYEWCDLFERINGRRMRELLYDFGRIPSPLGATAIATEWYAGYLRASGAAEVQLVRYDAVAPSLIAGFPGLRRGPILEVLGCIGDFPPGAAAIGRTDEVIRGRGLIGSKAELVAAAEAARVLTDRGPLPGGGLLFVVTPRGASHQEHVAPVARLMERGALGDAVLLAGGEHAVAPVVGLGRGAFTLTFLPGRTADERPDSAPIDAAQCFLALLRRTRGGLARQADPLAGPEQLLVQEVVGGPLEDDGTMVCRIKGEWHWVPGRSSRAIHQELQLLASRAAARHHTVVDLTFTSTNEGYTLNQDEPLVQALRTAYEHVMGHPLPAGPTNDGACADLFLHTKGVPAIAHGLNPQARGTAAEAVTVTELVRLSRIYLSLFLHYLHPTFATGRECVPAPVLGHARATR